MENDGDAAARLEAGIDPQVEPETLDAIVGIGAIKIVDPHQIGGDGMNACAQRQVPTPQSIGGLCLDGAPIQCQCRPRFRPGRPAQSPPPQHQCRYAICCQ